MSMIVGEEAMRGYSQAMVFLLQLRWVRLTLCKTKKETARAWQAGEGRGSHTRGLGRLRRPGSSGAPHALQRSASSGAGTGGLGSFDLARAGSGNLHALGGVGVGSSTGFGMFSAVGGDGSRSIAGLASASSAAVAAGAAPLLSSKEEELVMIEMLNFVSVLDMQSHPLTFSCVMVVVSPEYDVSVHHSRVYFWW